MALRLTPCSWARTAMGQPSRYAVRTASVFSVGSVALDERHAGFGHVGVGTGAPGVGGDLLAVDERHTRLFGGVTQALVVRSFDLSAADRQEFSEGLARRISGQL
ncbi:hypothetical protein ACIHFE_32920 [Streptomyces sp. NPDC052396]|uniref:hypothetical protein n=1 Tax=Streptomyces sp. NPDC052396 TaxID=3365689 RepID=UPI0037D61EDB